MDTRASNIEQNALNLSLVTKSESHQLLFEWNNTQADYPKNKCIHQLFESQVEQTPDNIAVSFEEKQLTYWELNCQANKVAHYLQTLNVGPEVMVGIYLERSLDLVIGLLGILKAGGAYLPLDTSYRADRLRFILEDAEVPILLTQSHFIETLPKCGTYYICLDTDWQAIAKHSTNNELSEVTPNHLAYVIYTSGSTGKPKGVAMPHRPLVNLLTWQLQNFRIPRARTLQFTPISFDVSFQEIFSTLCSGGTLVLVSESTRRNSEALLQYLCEQAIERLFLPYIALQHLAEVGKNQITLPIYLREAITAGEQLKITQSISHWFSRLEDCTLENQYGPSESHVVTAYRLSGSPQDWPHLPPIGRPIANTQIYLLNPKLRRTDDPAELVPIGEPGEVAIGGVSLARGYLNQPELTNSKFILDPFSDEPGARLYRTGDLARYRPDGTLEFIERLDHQVKIRGFRVELGEIEVTLSHHPAVKDVVVVVREDSLDNKRLVAYVVTKNSKSGDTMALQLRTELQDKLPDYMLPSAFVFMDALPLTSSGKVDRRTLPAPNRHRPVLKEDFVPPSTQVEEQLSEIWSQVLGIEPVGIYDNFFDLGGNSLQTIQLIFKVRETFQAELPIVSLFDAPTVAKFAEVVNASICSNLTVTSDDITISELEAEAALDPTIAPSSLPIKFASEPDNIFITGVTGFLGAFLLHELLKQTQATIYCLVRSSSPESGKQKIKRNLEHYLLRNEELDSRIIPVLGDLSQPLLGLAEHQFRKLASEIDLIYHNGAFVNLIYPYTALRATNVLGTQEILRLASQIKVKPVHYISTIDVFQSAHYFGRKVIQEQDALDYSERLYNGYAQSKWVAEKLVMTARVRGIPVCIYRPGMIAGHSQTGVSHTDDMMCRIIKGFIQLGSAPDLDLMVNMSPVDYVSRAIIHLSRQKELLGKVFHLVNPHSLHLSKFVKEINSLGYPMQQIAYDKWQAKLRNVNIFQKNALSALVSLFAEGISEKQMTYLKTSSICFQSFDCQNTVDGLAGTAIVCPRLDARLLSTYFSYFSHSGFLDTSQILTKTATYFDKKINSFSQNGWCETKSALSYAPPTQP